MATLLICYDPNDLISVDPEISRAGVKSASIHVAEQDPEDIYTLARKLAEMLLEQL